MSVPLRSERFRSDLHEPTLAHIPARVRGEAFNQKPKVTYSFGRDDLVANLHAVHGDRAVVVKIDVAAAGSINHGYARLSRRREKESKLLLTELRSKFVSFRATVMRVLNRKHQDIHVVGPLIPHEAGLALMTLVIKVSHDANFDHAYRKARRFLELHRENDDRTRFARDWYRADSPQKTVDYSWSDEELSTIEEMARLEPVSYAHDDDPALQPARRAYNDELLIKCQAALKPRNEVASDALRRELMAD